MQWESSGRYPEMLIVFELYEGPVAQSPRLGASNRVFAGVGRIDYESEPAEETLGGRGFVDLRKGPELREGSGLPSWPV
jgi:hypothetical protein